MEKRGEKYSLYDWKKIETGESEKPVLFLKI